MVLAAAPVSAQLDVRLRLAKQEVLLYESILVQVQVQNLSGRPRELAGGGAEGWLTFLITDDAGRMIRALDDSSLAEPILLDPGETWSGNFDLLPFYDLRAAGVYRLNAVVDSGRGQVHSRKLQLVIMAGSTLWRQTVGLPTIGVREEQERTYTLIAKQEGRYKKLYARVTDPRHGLVYGTLPLGTYVPVGTPQAQLDKGGQLHLLFRSGSRAFQYRKIDPAAEVVEAAAYSDLQSDPELVVYPDGNIRVKGGEQVYPRQPGALPLAEPEPPPPPKKSWWQFWK